MGNRYDNDFFEQLIDGFKSKNIDGTYSPIRGLDTNSFAKEYNKSLLHGDEGLRLEIPSNHGALIKKKVFEELGYFYEDFIYAVLTYVKKNSDRMSRVKTYIQEHPEALTSDVLQFISDQPDFYEDAFRGNLKVQAG